jgi:cyclohexadienyl dehydratase
MTPQQRRVDPPHAHGDRMTSSLSRCLAALSFVLASIPAQAQTQADSTLDTVMKAGVLRACTPGDYKPFSFLKPDGSYEGIDIDLAQSLAAAIGAKLELVKTSWANLVPDFAAGKCDIAIGGISVTTERQKRVFFSTAYMVNGKTPIVRCDDVKKFQSVADIDKAGVRVIANPGGSNERFAKANFKTATLTIHAENLTIFDEILAKRADVFVTEAAEALTQQKLKPGLCAVNPDKPLQYGEMAYMLPRNDAVMKSFVDQWLHLSKASGEYQKTVDKWLR